MTKVCSFTSLVASAVTLPPQTKIKSSARFDTPVSALDIGFKTRFFLKHLFSSWPKRLQKLHWVTLQVACLCPLLPQRLHFPVNFSGSRAELFATVPLDNKATCSLRAVAVCRLQDLSKFFIAFFNSAKDASSIETTCHALYGGGGRLDRMNLRQYAICH